jgi:hypothetical protein
MGMRRYLLVVDTDLLAMNEEHDLGPVSYLVARQERGPCETVVLSLARQAGDSAGVDARHRMDRAVQRLKNLGCPASGIISHDDLVTAVRAETSARHYDEVILATSRPEVARLARVAGRDPVHQLRRAWADRLIVFPADAVP